MILIIGGSYQGKRAYAQQLSGLQSEAFADGGGCDFEEVYQCRGIYNFHLFVRRFLDKLVVDTDDFYRRLVCDNPEIIIVSDEIGYGIVPVDESERVYREQHGRILCRLSEQAKTVHRVVCGIPMVIKDE